MLMPPSIGMQGGGQQPGLPGPGGGNCENIGKETNNINITNCNLFISVKNMFLFTLKGMFMLKLDICILNNK